MRVLTAFILVLSLVSSAPCKEYGLEIFGYFESQFLGNQLHDHFLQLYSNKLRVDFHAGLMRGVHFAANYTALTYHGKTVWNILDFLSPAVSATIPPSMTGFYTLPFSDRYYLDNAYVKIAFRRVDLTAGKQQISLGTGYAWNPMDIFNSKDLLDPTYEQPGHNAVRLDIPLGTNYTVTALYAPDESLAKSAKMLRFKGQISHFDYSVMVIQKEWRSHDYTRFSTTEMSFFELPERRELLGVSTAGEFLGMGVWSECAYNRMERSDNFYEVVIGTDYTFDFQTYFMVEYYRNSLGKTDYREYDLNDWMHLLTFEQKAICRDQLYLYLQHPATDFVAVGLSSIVSISDGSLALVPTLHYSYSEDVELLAYVNINIGSEGKAYAETMGNGGLIRARVYF